MSDILIDSNLASPTYGDIVVKNGDLQFVTGSAEILQNILQELRFFQGEWFMNNTLGVPWFQQILRKNPSQSKIDATLVKTIVNVPGVTQLLSYASSIDTKTRSMTVNFRVLTTSGIVNYSGVI